MPACTAVSVLSHVPEGSALARQGGEWPLTTHVAVRTLEEINHLGRITLSAAGVKRRDLPEPLVIPRPGENKPRPESEPIRTTWVADLIEGAGIEIEAAH